MRSALTHPTPPEPATGSPGPTGYPGPARQLPHGEVVHTAIARQARLRPDTVAIEHGGDRLTYAELDAHAEALAGRLRERGAGPESTVAVYAGPSLAVVVGAVAAMKAGAAYVPVDPEYPEARVGLLLADCTPAAVVCRPELADRLPPGSAPVVTWDPAPAPDPPDPPGVGAGAAAAVSGDHAACVIYTSGSTGAPKGVVITHRGLANLAMMAADRFALRPGDRFLQLAAVGFSAFLEEVFPSLLCGATVVLAGFRRALASVPELLRVLRDGRIARFGITTAYWHALVDELAATGERFPPDLRMVLMGGERARPEQVAKWSRFGVPLVHVYGPTEATATVTYLHTGEVDPGGYGDWRLPIGTTVPNTTVRLLDPDLRPVPEGTAGELYAGGTCLARGYHGSPGLTAARFVPDPYGAPGARLYRTGDLVRCLPDGNLEFLGRLDAEQKVRGHRLQPAEVETAIESHPLVRRAVVLVRPDRSGDRRLVAYLLAEPGTVDPVRSLSIGRLREHLAPRLPEYLLPAACLVLGSLPLTPNGKVDTEALPAPDGGRPLLDGPYEPPATATERRLAQLWSELLEVRPVGAGDQFVELGGDSLLAARCLSAIRREFGVELTLTQVLRGGTIRQLADAVDGLAATATPGGTVAGSAVAGGAVAGGDGLVRATGKRRLVARALRRAGAPPGSCLLSVSQQGLWVLHQLAPESPLYNVPLRLRFSGQLDVAVFTSALATVVARHEALQLRFFTVEGKAVQAPRAAGPAPLRVVDVSELAAAEQVAEAERLVQEEASAPFDLADGPAFRCLLIRLDVDEYELVCNAHHLVFDGRSAKVLLGELAVTYAAMREGVQPALPPLPATYTDFALWQRDRLRGERLQALLEFWSRQLQPAPEVLELTSRPRPQQPGHAGANLRLPLPPDLKERLAATGRAEHATLFMVLLTGFYAMLRHHSGRQDLCVGSPVANRMRPELEDVVGFFVNTVVLRTEARDDDTLRTLLQRVRQTCLDAYEQQELPFDLLVERLQPARRTGVNPFFQVNFSVDEAPGSGLSFPDVTVHQGREVATGTAKFDLTWLVEDLGGTMVVDVGYHTGIFEPAEVLELVSTYRAVLRQLASDLDCPVTAAVETAAGEPARPGAVADPAGAAPAADTVLAADHVEHALYEMWSEAFGGVSFSVHDDFFALGGYSLLASELCARINERFAVDLPLRAFFESPTVAELAERVRTAPVAAQVPEPVAAGPGPGLALGALLEQIEGLSEDEVAAALEQTVREE